MFVGLPNNTPTAPAKAVAQFLYWQKTSLAPYVARFPIALPYPRVVTAFRALGSKTLSAAPVAPANPWLLFSLLLHVFSFYINPVPRGYELVLSIPRTRG